MQESRALLTGCNVEGEKASSARALDALERSLDGMLSCSGSVASALRVVDVAVAATRLDLVSTVVAHSPRHLPVVAFRHRARGASVRER